jgi:V/A-type H+-transporting ATPase subunit I
VSIVRLAKVTVIGITKDERRVLSELQELGCVHLRLLRQKPVTLEEQTTAPTTDAAMALRYLRESPIKRRQVSSDLDFDIHNVTERVLDNLDIRRSTMDRRDELLQRLKDLEPWGDFTFAPLAEMGGQRLWFYSLPRGKLKHLDEVSLPWQVVHLDPSTAWLVIISPTEPAHDMLPVPRTHTGCKRLRDVRQELEDCEIELDEIESQRQSLTRWITLIVKFMARAQDTAELEFALNHSTRQESCFAIQGWAPLDRSVDLTLFADAMRSAVVFEDPTPEDEPPTLLRTPKELSAGEDLVRFYQMPSYWGWDPSGILFVSFALFFSMILSDAGYAALLGLLLGALWRKLGLTDGGRRWRTFLALIVSLSVVWGVMVGSYFGLEPPGNWMVYLKLFDLSDFNTMMKLSVSIGAIHIALANIQMVILWWGDRRAAVHFGWILVLVGGMTIWMAVSDGTAHNVGAFVLVAGLLTVFLCSGTRRIHSLGDCLVRIFEGMQELTRLIRILSDVLSYLRLFALGLASASLALTFNDLARQAAESIEGIGLLAAILILLVGHTLNLSLAVISGVVHGLRLNYIEFYNWGLAGEGYPFRAFRKKELSE